MSHKILSYADFDELLSYDKEIGKIYQKKKRPKISVGSEAGTITPFGHRYVQLFGRKYPIHHLVWLFETKSFPEKFLDHKDGNPINNKFSNLREVTTKQNTENRGKQKNNKTGFKGVSFNCRLQKYVAQIQHNSKTIYLGVYKTPEEASFMYQSVAKELFSHYKK
jgi:hypothetical protein